MIKIEAILGDRKLMVHPDTDAPVEGYFVLSEADINMDGSVKNPISLMSEKSVDNILKEFYKLINDYVYREVQEQTTRCAELQSDLDMKYKFLNTTLDNIVALNENIERKE